jgi:L-fuculose-phosphate aldolase
VSAVSFATRRQLEEQVVRYSQRLHQAGWVANHDGNVSIRLEADRFLITPTSYSKASVEREDLVVVDGLGAVVSGRKKPPSELELHLYLYRKRPDIHAVLHAHPPAATGMSVAGVAVRPTMLAEPVVSLGRVVPLVPYARPKTPEFTGNFAACVEGADAWTMEHHGAITVGPDLDTAYLRLELVEHLAKIQLAAQAAGRVRDIPESDMGPLLEARAKAGLGLRKS